jgi:hypothetical protein
LRVRKRLLGMSQDLSLHDRAEPAQELALGRLERAKIKVHHWSEFIRAGLSIFSFFFFLVFLYLAFFTGLIDSLRSGTTGVIIVESPQIYTRERLVNDRFREQAWLEKQLLELEARAELVSSYRKDSLKVNVGVASGDAAGAANSVNESGTAAGRPESLEDKLLVSADDSFNLQRNMRATIRRALIENELDDRHDLGSNSLYQFNFGVAIIAGVRTRKLASIEMEIEPVEPLRPLAKLIVDEFPRCTGLFEFECAHLFETGILSSPTLDEEELVNQYARWKDLYRRWIGFENAGYEREAGDLNELMRSNIANDRTKEILEPFFDNLNAQALALVRDFNSVLAVNSGETGKVVKLFDIACTYNKSGEKSESISRKIGRFLNRCVSSVNKILSKEGEVFDSASKYIVDSRIIDRELLAQISEPNDKGLFIWEQYFKSLFKRLNEECEWEDAIVTRVSGSPSYFRLTDSMETQLLDCIEKSIIRDYGSHPFGRIKRDDGGFLSQFRGGNYEIRPIVSAYLVRDGLSGVVVTSLLPGSRGVARSQYAGIIARPATLKSKPTEQPPQFERHTFGVEALKSICGHVIAAAGQANLFALDGADLGVASTYYLKKLSSPVDQDIGWNFLSYLICSARATYSGSTETGHVDKNFSIPIGLFRFISHLSNTQKTFSYSVQPSGAFNLQRREASTSFKWRDVLYGASQEKGIAVGGDTTENWIEKQYRVIGFGGQLDEQASTVPPVKDGSPESKKTGSGGSGSLGKEQQESAAQRRAKFGWYVFPANQRGYLVGPPVMDSANIKLSALVSLPAWWDSVNIKIATSWRDPATPEVLGPQSNDFMPQSFRVELPTRLEFIRNHFPNTSAIRPSLHQLQLPDIVLRACEPADIVLKGERLWRSTVVTIGAQKSTLIQVMPDMHGIIAHFDQILPANTKQGNSSDSKKDTVSVTVWTSEGQKTVLNTVEILLDKKVEQRIAEGGPPCVSAADAASKRPAPSNNWTATVK